MIITEPLIICNVKSKSNIIYTKDAITKMLGQWELKDSPTLVYSRPPVDNEDIAPSLRDVCGQVKSFSLVGNVLYVKMNIFDSSINPVYVMYKSGGKCNFSPVGLSKKIKKDGAYIYYEYMIDSVNLVRDSIW